MVIRWLKRVFQAGGEDPGDDETESGELLPASVKPVAPPGKPDRRATAEVHEIMVNAAKAGAPLGGSLAAAYASHTHEKRVLREAFESAVGKSEPDRTTEISDAIVRFVESGVLDAEPRVASLALMDLLFYLRQVSAEPGSRLARSLESALPPPLDHLVADRRYSLAIQVMTAAWEACEVGEDWLLRARARWHEEDGAQPFPSLHEHIAWAREVGQPLQPLEAITHALSPGMEKDPEGALVRRPVVTSVIDLCLSSGDLDAFERYDSAFRALRGAGLAPDKHPGKSFKEWCVKHAKEGRPEKALAIAEAGAAKGLSDGTKGRFETRAARLRKLVPPGV